MRAELFPTVINNPPKITATTRTTDLQFRVFIVPFLGWLAPPLGDGFSVCAVPRRRAGCDSKRQAAPRSALSALSVAQLGDGEVLLIQAHFGLNRVALERVSVGIDKVHFEIGPVDRPAQDKARVHLDGSACSNQVEMVGPFNLNVGFAGR
jgi:hypothetical protein